MNGYLAGLAKLVEVVRWPKKVKVQTVRFAEATVGAVAGPEQQPRPLTAEEAAHQMLESAGGDQGRLLTMEPFDGAIEETALPNCRPGACWPLWPRTGKPARSLAPAMLRAAELFLSPKAVSGGVLVLVPANEDVQRRTIAQLEELGW